MRSSDKINNKDAKPHFPNAGKKAIGILIKIVCCILALALIGSLLGYLTVPSTSYTRIQFHDLYTKYGKNGDNIDLLFLGTSHAYRGFDTQIFDEDLQIDSYNFGTSMQTVTASYYVLKEVLKTNHPDKVVFELTYTCFRDKDHKPLKSVIVSQYMRPSLNKFDFILHEFDLENIFFAVLPAYTFREKLNAEALGSNLKAKATTAYKTYDVASTKSENEWMEHKGYVYTNKSFRILHAGQMDPEPFEEDMLSPKFLEYFDKMVALCKDAGVEFICVTAPVPKPTLLELGNYGEICDFLNDLTEKNDITYYNFNLLKDEWLPLNNGNFYDSNHINGETSKDFSHLVAKIFAEEDAGTLNRGQYFYRDWEEAKSHLDYIANAYMTVEADENNYIVTGHATSGIEDARYEYSYWLYDRDNEANSQLLRGWSTYPVYVMPKNFREDRWRLMLAVRFAGSDTEMMYSQRDVLLFPRTVAVTAE